MKSSFNSYQPTIVAILLFCSVCHFLPFCIASSAINEVENETPFTYTEGHKGPKEWGHINPHWRVCDNGKFQSPIDLLSERVHILPYLGKLKKDYKPAPAVLQNRGHDVMVKWKGDAGQININGTYYKLIQCHWHSPSEHTFNGTRYDLELHMVHQSAHKKLAVIAIVYQYGRRDPFLSQLFHYIKRSGNGIKEKNLGIINPGDIKFGSRKYYRYIGSLTVPPCTEGVIWTILKKVRTVSRDQVRALRDAVHDGFEANARPTQRLDKRPVLMFTPRENGASA